MQTAQAVLVGRRIIALAGPFGPGVEALPHDTLSGTTMGQIDLLGNVEGEAIGIAQRQYLPLPLIYKDFWVHWRDLETNRQFGLPLDTGTAAAAAAACAQAEDRLVFDGDPALQLPGLRTVNGRQTQPMSDWGQEGQAFADVVALDLSTAFVESTNLNYRMRVVESLVLRIRRPGAICTFEPPAGAPGSARAGRR